MFTSILIAADGRTGGKDALALGRQLAVPDAQIVVAHGHCSDRELHSLAERQRADLVVVGASLVVRDLFRPTACAIAVAPRGYGPNAGPIRQLGVGCDRSRDSGIALGVARELVSETDASITTIWLVSLDNLVADGESSPELGRLADAVDLMILGARSHGLIRPLLQASVSRQVAGRTGCPLLVLPPDPTGYATGRGEPAAGSRGGLRLCQWVSS